MSVAANSPGPTDGCPRLVVRCSSAFLRYRSIGVPRYFVGRSFARFERQIRNGKPVAFIGRGGPAQPPEARRLLAKLGIRRSVPFTSDNLSRPARSLGSGVTGPRVSTVTRLLLLRPHSTEPCRSEGQFGGVRAYVATPRRVGCPPFRPLSSNLGSAQERPPVPRGRSAIWFLLRLTPARSVPSSGPVSGNDPSSGDTVAARGGAGRRPSPCLEPMGSDRCAPAGAVGRLRRMLGCGPFWHSRGSLLLARPTWAMSAGAGVRHSFCEFRVRWGSDSLKELPCRV